MINWTRTYIASQIFVVAMYTCLCITYFLRNRKKILILNIIAQTLEGISFFLLGGLTGVAMDIINISRNIFFVVDEKKNGKSDKITKRDVVILVCFIIAIVALTIFTYDGLSSLLSVVSTVIFTFAVWQKNTTVYKILGIPVSLTWLGYQISLKSIFAIILESILLASTITGYTLDAIKIKKDKLNFDENNIS